jgi:hypothetical protein
MRFGPAMKSVFCALAMAAALGFASAQAQDPILIDRGAPISASGANARVITTIDAAMLLTTLQRGGFQGEIKREGDQTFILARANTTPFQIMLSNCESGATRCTDLEIFAGFTPAQRVAIERINAWNARTRFARAFLQENGAPALQMDLYLSGGLSLQNLSEQLELWGGALTTFQAFLQPRAPTANAAPQPAQKQNAPDALRPRN